MSLIDNEPHSATVRAEVQTDVLMLGRLEFARCLPENSSMAYAVMRGLVQLFAARRSQDRVAGPDGCMARARALLEFASQTPEGELLIRERISRQDIAKMVGASREMVSRVMKDLEERGFIETQENGAILVNRTFERAGLSRSAAQLTAKGELRRTTSCVAWMWTYVEPGPSRLREAGSYRSIPLLFAQPCGKLRKL